MRRPIVQDAAWAFLGSAGSAALQWAVLVVIARHGGALAAGEVALALALVTPVMILANLHLRALLVSDPRGDFAPFLGVRSVSTLVALVTVAALAVLGGFDGHMLALTMAVAVMRSVDAVAELFYGRWQRDQALRRVACSQLARSALVLAVTAAGCAGGWTLPAILGASAAAALAVVAALDVVPFRRELSIDLTSGKLGPLLALALPMGGVMALGSLMVNVPRYGVQAYHGTEALGHFATTAALLVAVAQPMLAIGAALSPRLARAWQSDRATYRVLVGKTVRLAVAFGVVTVAGSIVFGETLLQAAYGTAFTKEVRTLDWLAAAAAIGFVSSAFGYALTAARQVWAQCANAAIGFAVCTIASLAFVPTHGLVGAAWALVATELTRMVCAGIVVSSLTARDLQPTLGVEVARAA